MLSGSYHPDDVIFLLKEVEMEFTTVRDKERLIQSGKRHYSEIIHFEPAPDPAYLALFDQMVDKYAPRMGSEAAGLAQYIHEQYTGPITLLSLARAGTPVGALLNRILKQRFGRESAHYSLSIIRDRGIDENALRHITQTLNRPRHSTLFIDGWTAKGVITRELRQAIQKWNRENPSLALPDQLLVISDIGGTADVAATVEDYAIPSGILNAPVSGLLSRSILNDEVIGPDDFHGTVRYEHLLPYDRSNAFLDRLSAVALKATPSPVVKAPQLARVRKTMEAYVAQVLLENGISDINLVKPGVAEATRVMMRRVPGLLILKDPAHPDVAHLLHLAQQKSVPIHIDPESPLLASALIRSHKS